jgi:lysozyme
MLYGIDVSYAQGGSIDWKAVKGAGIDFAYARACYGSNPADDDGAIFTANHDGCKANGIPFGPYMFFLLTEDPVAQAFHFLDLIDGYEGQLRPMVDVEEGSGTMGSVVGNIAALAAFNTTVAAASATPIIYTNQDTWDNAFGGSDDFSGHTLWVASFTGTPGNPAMPQGWKAWTIQQYSSGGSIAGIPGFVDLDCYNGTDLKGITR